MLDYLIKGGTVVDGTGAAPREADVGIRDRRIVEIGVVAEDAITVLDADGLLVTPGFVDPHTHYDAQLHWDGWATPSSQHGVTSVIAGNCGFTLAPLKPEDALYTQRMMARVEGMPIESLQQGPSWEWRTFGEFLDRLDGQVAVNAGFLVGHCRAPTLGARRGRGRASLDRGRARCHRSPPRGITRGRWARPVAVAFVHAHRR